MLLQTEIRSRYSSNPNIMSYQHQLKATQLQKPTVIRLIKECGIVFEQSIRLWSWTVYFDTAGNAAVQIPHGLIIGDLRWQSVDTISVVLFFRSDRLNFYFVKNNNESFTVNLHNEGLEINVDENNFTYVLVRNRKIMDSLRDVIRWHQHIDAGGYPYLAISLQHGVIQTMDGQSVKISKPIMLAFSKWLYDQWDDYIPKLDQYL